MTDRMHGPRIRPLVVALIASAFTWAPDAHASVPGTDPRWLPWIGCWAPSGASEDAAPAVAGVQRVCVLPAADSSGVDVVSVANGEVVSRQRIDASGVQRRIEREGCTGWESARWSTEGERIFLRSEVTCSGIVRRTSGIIAVASPSDWVDVQVVSVADQRSTRILRYRSVLDTSALGREVAAAVRDRELARQTARLAAASSPSVADVIEASREAEESVVEAWLLQRMPRFSLDAGQLRTLGSARVPARVIDLMVALGSPGKFSDRLATRGYTFMRIDQPRSATVAVASPQILEQTVQYSVGSSGATIEGREFYGHLHRHYEGCGHFDLVYIGGVPLAPYGFYPYWPRGAYGGRGYYGYGQYGYGYGYYPYDIHDPYRATPNRPTTRAPSRVLDLPNRRPAQPTPEPATPASGGRIVNGRGYTKPVEPTSDRAAPPTPAPPSRIEPSAPAPSRTAVPRPAPPTPPPSSSEGSRGQGSAPAEAKPAPETRPVPQAPIEPGRTAKRRPPPGSR